MNGHVQYEDPIYHENGHVTLDGRFRVCVDSSSRTSAIPRDACSMARGQVTYTTGN